MKLVFSHHSKGSVLVFSLVILLLIELTAMTMVSSINITSHILRNHEKKQAIDRDADNLINYVITNKNYFLGYSDYINAQGNFEIAIPDYVVAAPRSGRIAEFECIDCASSYPMKLSKAELMTLDDTHWTLKIEVSDLQIGSKVAVGQGLWIRIHSHPESLTNQNKELHSTDAMGMSVQTTWWYSQPLTINHIR